MAELDLPDMLIQPFSQKDNRSTRQVGKRLMKRIADYSIREYKSGLLENIIGTNKCLLTNQHLDIILKYSFGEILSRCTDQESGLHYTHHFSANKHR